jgi:uncharacterized protein (TIGR03086 family)
MPIDELESAQESLAVLQQVLRGIAKGDEAKPTPCREFDVAALTDHLMNSITVIGAAAGAQFPDRDRGDAVEGQVMPAARQAVDAWQQRGLDGMVTAGQNEAPAKVVAGILSLEFLVHAWDYAKSTGREVKASDELSDYVLGLAKTIITPQGRSNVGFDDPVDVAADARALDRLIAYTGRVPG